MTQGRALRTIRAVGIPAATFEVRPPSVRETMLGGGPRFARDAFGPPLAFYVGWKAGGLIPGIAASTAVSLLAWRVERKAGRPGFMARLSLGLVVLQAVIGLIANSERVYLAQPVLVNAALGLAFLGSVALRRPLAAAFAEEMYPFPDEVRQSVTFRRIFGRISMLWGTYLCLRSATRLVALQAASIEEFLIVNFATGMPLMAVLMAFSIWYAVGAFRRSDEWGPAIRLLDELEAAAGSDPPEASHAAEAPPAPAVGQNLG